MEDSLLLNKLSDNETTPRGAVGITEVPWRGEEARPPLQGGGAAVRLAGQTALRVLQALEGTDDEELLTLCSAGRAQELERLLAEHPARLGVRDRGGRGPLHRAAAGGQGAIMDLLLAHGADINLVDNEGNTPLHVSVESNQSKSVTYLLTNGANAALLNARHMAPVHLAVDLERTDVLDLMLGFDGVDVNLGGENGSTPLHYAAWRDHADCARILLAHDALLCRACDIGLYPLHIAAQNSSSATLQVILEYAEKKGCSTKASLLTRVNQEHNTALHAAVSGGNTRIVELCLKAGAPIDVQQESGSTPVHLAAAQGSLDVLRLMFELQPARRAPCLQARDRLGLTPLHTAAMFDRTPAVDYLILQGSELDARCEDGQTPLLLAASKCAWGAVNALLRAGACCTHVDAQRRNLLHLIIRGGARPSQFECCPGQESTKKEMLQLLEAPDAQGCTPLHYASRLGQLATLDQLLLLGASAGARDHKKQSALHFAARHGRYNTCVRLIRSDAGSTTILNEADGSGQTALHAAAEGGHARVIQLLLQAGAGVFKDLVGNTPLHLAAVGGYTQSVCAVMHIHPQLLDSPNKNLDTPLHLAAIAGQEKVVSQLLNLGAAILLNKDGLHVLDISIKHGKKDVATAVISHDRWREAMDMKSTLYGCPMGGMIQYMPEVCLMVLDRCRTMSGCDPKVKDFHYTYSFQFMQMEIGALRALRKSGSSLQPLFALNKMVQFNRVECLSHPVCTAFLTMKWCAYGMWFHITNLLVYATFLACLTSFIASYDFPHVSPSCVAPPGGGVLHSDAMRDVIPNNNLTEGVEGGVLGGVPPDCEHSMVISVRQKVLAAAILIFCLVNAIKEVVQMWQQRWAYLADASNLFEWILYVTTAIFVGPFLVAQSSPAQWQCGAVASFLAWFNLLLFLQRFDVFGIYVVMFLEILKTLIQVITVFSVLIVAFGFAFFILLNTGTAEGFATPELSLMSTSIMMLGSIDYLDVWVAPLAGGRLAHPTLCFLALLLFILLMPILLINLMIGLAVGDIEAVQKDAQLKRIAMQVQLHTDLEQKLPTRLLQLIDRPFVDLYPHSGRSWVQRMKNRMMRKNDPDLMDEASLSVMDQNAEHQNYIYRQMDKHKSRLKQISAELERQHDLLRLIVQKMEIRTEADDFDEIEGSEGGVPRPPTGAPGGSGIGWSSPVLRQVMLKQALVLSKFKKSVTD